MLFPLTIFLAVVFGADPFLVPTSGGFASPPSKYHYQAHYVLEFEESDSELIATLTTSVRFEDMDGNGVPLETIYIPVPDNAVFEMEKMAINGVRLESISDYYQEAEQSDIFIPSGGEFIVPNPNTPEQTTLVTYSYKLEFDDPAFLPVFYVPNVYGLVDYTLEIKSPHGYHAGLDVLDRSENKLTESRTSERNRSVYTAEYRELPYRYDEYIDWSSSEHAALRVTLTRDGETVLRDTPEAFTNWYLRQLQMPQFDDKIAAALRDNEPDKRQLAVLSLLARGPDYAHIVADLQRKSEARGTKRDNEVNQALLNMAEAYTAMWALRERIASEDEDELTALYDWAQHIRYVADHSEGHSIIPRDASDILSTGYGDCKDRSSILMALLQMAGYKSFLVLVKTYGQYEFDDVAATAFDHMITAVETEEGLVYLDPTSRYAPYGSVPASLAGRRVLLLDPENPRWEFISPPDNRDVSIEITGSLDEMSSMYTTVSFRSNWLPYIKRVLSRATNSLDRENLFSILVNDELYHISLNDFNLRYETDSLVVVNATADISEFVIQTDRATYVPRLPLVVQSNSLNRWSQNRGTVELGFLPRMNISLTLEAPGYTLVPERHAVDEAGIGSFLSTAENPGADKFTFEYVYQLERLNYNDESESNFIKFLTQVASSRSEVFVLSRSENHE